MRDGLPFVPLPNGARIEIEPAGLDSLIESVNDGIRRGVESDTGYLSLALARTYGRQPQKPGQFRPKKPLPVRLEALKARWRRGVSR